MVIGKESVKKKPDKFGTGGNSNAWASRYREMLLKYKIMQELEVGEDILKGFSMAISVFESVPRTKKIKKVKNETK